MMISDSFSCNAMLFTIQSIFTIFADNVLLPLPCFTFFAADMTDEIPKDTLFRLFPYKSVDLGQIGKNLVILLTRDVAMLEERGVDMTVINALKEQIEDYRNFSANQVFKSYITKAKNARNEKYKD